MVLYCIYNVELEGIDMKTKNNQNAEVKKEKKSFKKVLMKNAPIICISFAAFLLLVGVLVVVFQAKEEITQYTIKNERLYTYMLNHRLDMTSQVTLDHDDNVTKMIYNGEEITLVSEPIYYTDKKEAILPNDMSVVFPRDERRQKKINRYTKVEEAGSQVVLMSSNLKYALTDAFVYDGDNVYFFADDGVVKYGDKTIPVSKFSMVTCEYRGSIAIYDYKTQKMTYEEKFEGNVIAEFENYSINLSEDKVIVKGESSLLDKNVETQGLLTNR